MENRTDIERKMRKAEDCPRFLAWDNPQDLPKLKILRSYGEETLQRVCKYESHTADLFIYLSRNPGCSKKQIMDATGMWRYRIDKSLSELKEEGLVSEIRIPPKRGYYINGGHPAVICRRCPVWKAVASQKEENKGEQTTLTLTWPSGVIDDLKDKASSLGLDLNSFLARILMRELANN